MFVWFANVKGLPILIKINVDFVAFKFSSFKFSSYKMSQQLTKTEIVHQLHLLRFAWNKANENKYSGYATVVSVFFSLIE